MDEQTGEIIKEVGKEIAKDMYDDVGKPVLNPTGQTVGLIPRAIKAALLPIEKWILTREYNLKETEKILESKLKNANPEDILTPEPYIAVPTLQYISYCMDSEQLRNMYANLLASSMNKKTKNRVHPGFSEIIKQLSSDEAKILKEFYKLKQIPIIGVRYENEKGHGIDIVKKFSDIGEKAKCEYPYDIEKYLDNLERLGLIESTTMNYLTDDSKYNELKNHKEIKGLENIPEFFRNTGKEKYKIQKGISKLTTWGVSFCNICVINND